MGSLKRINAALVSHRANFASISVEYAKEEYIMSRKYLYFIIVCLLLVACDSVQYTAPANTIPTPAANANTNITLASPSAIPELSAGSDTSLVQTAAPIASVPSAAPVAETSAPVLSSNAWKTIEWESVRFTIPPQSTWKETSDPDMQITNAKLLNMGHVTYPEESNNIEGLQGPTFAIMLFSGSIDDWLQIEQDRNLSDNPIDVQTIHRQTIAGTAAIAYQRAVKGVATIEYYALKIDKDHLLWITTEDAENKIYIAIIQSLTIN